LFAVASPVRLVPRSGEVAPQGRVFPYVHGSNEFLISDVQDRLERAFKSLEDLTIRQPGKHFEKMVGVGA
jgi:hypothetical protein